MNDLPDDLRAIEKTLTQLRPYCGFDPDQWIAQSFYRTGYEAAMTERSQPTSMLKVFAGMVAGAAAMWIGMILFSSSNEDALSMPANEIAMTSETEIETSTVALNESVAETSAYAADRFLHSNDGTLGALGFRHPSKRLGAESVRLKQPMTTDSNSNRTNAQWQRALLSSSTIDHVEEHTL